MIKIGDFSKLSRISIRMLRHYDDIGLLKPETTDTFTGYRYYTAAQLTDAGRISMLKQMGFGLSAISELMQQYSDPQVLKQYLLIKQKELQEQLSYTADRLLQLESTINRLGKDAIVMKYDVTIKEMPKRYVMSLRKVIPAYNQEGLLWKQIGEETGRMGVKAAGNCNSLAIFHDEGYKEHDVDVEVQLTVEGQYQNTEHVVFKTVEPILIASAVYKGSYAYITEANQAVANWVNDNNYTFAGPAFSIYHVSPAFESNPDNYVTEVCFPVKKIDC